MSDVIEIKFTGLYELIRETVSVKRSLLSLEKIIERLYETVLLHIKDNFERGGTVSQQWTPLTLNTQTQKHLGLGYYESGGSDRGILRWSDRLFDTVTKKGGKGKTFHSALTGFTIRITLPEANVHHFGADVYRPEVVAKNDKVLRFVSPLGETIFTRRIKGASFRIPARPFVDAPELEKELAETFRLCMANSPKSMSGWLGDVFQKFSKYFKK